MKMKNMLTVSLVSLVNLGMSSNAIASDWSFELEPYLMLTNIVGDASIGRASGVPVDVDFNTILDNLDMAAMVHFEAHHKSGWGLAMDYGFMDLSAKKSNGRDGFAKVSLRQGVLETLGLYRVKYGRSQVDYFAGVRWWDNELALVVDPAILPGSTDIQIKESWVDVVAGVRWNSEINKNWNFVARADVGGFGLSADFTSTLEAGVTYKISKLMTLDMKYKASWVDYENGKTAGEAGYFAYDTITHGTVIGVDFSF